MRIILVVALTAVTGLSTTFNFASGFTGFGVSAAKAANQEVNLYSYRQPFLLKPLMVGFTKETGIKINVVYAKKKRCLNALKQKA